MDRAGTLEATVAIFTQGEGLGNSGLPLSLPPSLSTPPSFLKSQAYYLPQKLVLELYGCSLSRAWAGRARDGLGKEKQKKQATQVVEGRSAAGTLNLSRSSAGRNKKLHGKEGLTLQWQNIPGNSEGGGAGFPYRARATRTRYHKEGRHCCLKGPAKETAERSARSPPCTETFTLLPLRARNPFAAATTTFWKTNHPPP